MAHIDSSEILQYMKGKLWYTLFFEPNFFDKNMGLKLLNLPVVKQSSVGNGVEISMSNFTLRVPRNSMFVF